MPPPQVLLLLLAFGLMTFAFIWLRRITEVEPETTYSFRAIPAPRRTWPLTLGTVMLLGLVAFFAAVFTITF